MSIAILGVGGATVGARRSALTVQRMMTETEWLKSSALGSDTRALFKTDRKDVRAVDEGMAAFKAAKDYNPRQPEIADAKLVALGKIIAGCTDYAALKKANRKAAVQRLKVEAEAEKECLEMAIVARDTDDFKARMDGLLSAHEFALAKDKAGFNTSSVASYIVDLVSKTAREHDQADRPTLEAFVKADFARLEAIKKDKHAPPIVKAVIGEALEHIDKVHLGDFDSAGARAATAKDKAAGVTHQYVLNHKMAGVLGSSERVASLMHEMTHVASGESYGNTMLFLLFEKDAPAAAVVKLAKQRNEALKNLLELAAKAKEEKAISGAQYLLVKDKLEYGGAGSSGDKLKNYLASFKSQLTDDKHAELSAIAAQLSGFSSTVVEYDSVVNQVLLLLYEWKVPLEQAMYAYVRELATDAKAKRDDARERLLATAASGPKKA